MLLSFDKTKKVRSTEEHNKMHMSDSGVDGTYVPNMSKEDNERWKGKLIKGDDERIDEHGRRADTIVQSMMEHSRPSDGALVSTRFTPVLNQAVDLAYNSMQERNEGLEVEIQKAFDDSITYVDLLPQEFTRVIINVVDNAIYAVLDAAKQHALSGNNAFRPLVHVSSYRDQNDIVIAVKDNGVGMSEEVRSKIFDPFFTTKPTGAGNTGLGLSLSFDIIAQGHNGTIQVDSEAGRGSTFTIKIPGNTEQ